MGMSLLPGQAAPTFAAEAVVKGDFKKFDLADYKGQFLSKKHVCFLLLILFFFLSLSPAAAATAPAAATSTVGLQARSSSCSSSTRLTCKGFFPYVFFSYSLVFGWTIACTIAVRAPPPFLGISFDWCVRVGSLAFHRF